MKLSFKNKYLQILIVSAVAHIIYLDTIRMKQINRTGQKSEEGGGDTSWNKSGLNTVMWPEKVVIYLWVFSHW